MSDMIDLIRRISIENLAAWIENVFLFLRDEGPSQLAEEMEDELHGLANNEIGHSFVCGGCGARLKRVSNVTVFSSEMYGVSMSWKCRVCERSWIAPIRLLEKPDEAPF